MRRSARRHERRGGIADGFTMVELMIVVAIIGVLVAIAVPTFLASQNKAKDRSAQSSLRTSLNAALTAYADTQDYGQLTITSLARVEPSRTWLAANDPSLAPVQVSFDHPSASTFIAAANSVAGDCFFIRDDRTSSAGSNRFARVSGGLCQADQAPTAAAAWTAQW